MVKRFSEWLRKFFPWWMRIYHKFEVRGIENLPKSGSAIIAPNHSGAFDLDNFTLMSALERYKINNPSRKRIWLCYWDEWSIGDNLWSHWVQKFSPIPISLTGGGIPWKLLDKIVEKGELIAIMPEGHSAALYEGYRLWKFYPGVIKLHLRYKIPIIPTASIGFVTKSPLYSNRYNPEKVPPWEAETVFPFIFPGKLFFHFGPPLMFEEYFDKDVNKETMTRLAKFVRQKVAEMITLYRNGVSWKKPYGKKIKKVR
ncbi:MAG: lysophospholipid acyltransferase family protein [Promethearchaeota archaeon]